MVYTQEKGFFCLLPTNNLLVSCQQVGREKNATEVTTMVSQGTKTQQKTVSRPLTIHPSWCTGGSWCTVATDSLLTPKVIYISGQNLLSLGKIFCLWAESFVSGSALMFLGRLLHFYQGRTMNSSLFVYWQIFTRKQN